jgi:long-chain fatty acid transport protein
MEILVAVLLGLLVFAQHAEASGIYRNGVGARALSVAGADVAWAEAPLGVLGANPAGARQLAAPTFELGLSAGLAEGRFRNPVNDASRLRASGVLPEGAFAGPIGSTPLSYLLGAAPEAALAADWRYVDAPGGADGVASYGHQRHRAEILVLRSAAGLAWSLGERFSAGASVGLIYNENRLQAPYIFQSHPTLQGFKTLLDLKTSGLSVDGQVGALWRAHGKVQFGVTYQAGSRVRTTGNASGDATAQLSSLGGPFAGVRPDFRYDAEVVTHFPHRVSGGASWQAHPRWRLFGQVEWIAWSDAFDELDVKLTRGNNADLNTFLGSDSIRDTIPLSWKDQWVFRAGAEVRVLENLVLRGGYSYGESPVPAATLSPLTAAIFEHTLAAGVGYQRGRYRVDLGYQWTLPSRQNISQSELRSGEYDHSRVEAGLHWFALSAGVTF